MSQLPREVYAFDVNYLDLRPEAERIYIYGESVELCLGALVEHIKEDQSFEKVIEIKASDKEERTFFVTYQSWIGEFGRETVIIHRSVPTIHIHGLGNLDLNQIPDRYLLDRSLVRGY